MNDVSATTADGLMRAARIAREAGLRYVYAGNLPGGVGDLEHTRCHACREPLVVRHGYLIQRYNLTPAGDCPACGTHVPGRWAPAFEGQRTARPRPLLVLGSDPHAGVRPHDGV
jgi:pyruvate formate lyase activating enzyme